MQLCCFWYRSRQILTALYLILETVVVRLEAHAADILTAHLKPLNKIFSSKPTKVKGILETEES